MTETDGELLEVLVTEALLLALRDVVSLEDGDCDSDAVMLGEMELLAVSVTVRLPLGLVDCEAVIEDVADVDAEVVPVGVVDGSGDKLAEIVPLGESLLLGEGSPDGVPVGVVLGVDTEL